MSAAGGLKGLGAGLGALARTAVAYTVVPAATVGYGVAIIAGQHGAETERGRALMKAWAERSLWAAGVRLHVEGLEGLDLDRRYVVVSNHQSLIDVPTLVAAFPQAMRFVGKESAFKVPFFGHASRALGHVAIDRSNPEKARAIVSAWADRPPDGTSFLFFAEGTRSRDGSLGPFKRGCLAVAEQTRAPVLPVALVGAHDCMVKGSPIVRGGDIAVLIGRPLPAAHLPDTPRAERIEQVRDEVAALLERGRALLAAA